MTFAFYTTLVCFIALCVIFALLILIQKGRGGGISSAFGGAGGNTAFGSKTGDVLTWATSIIFAVFLTMCVALSLLAAAVDREKTGRGIVAPAQTSQSDLPADLPAADVTVPPANTSRADAAPATMSTTVPTTRPTTNP